MINNFVSPGVNLKKITVGDNYIKAIKGMLIAGSFLMIKLWDSIFVGSMEAPSKAFLLFFLLPDWLQLNHLKSRIECGFSDIFPRHFCSTVAKTVGLTNYAARFGAKKCSENHI